MRNLKEIENDIENIKKELEELKKAEKANKGRWKPEIGEKYWYISIRRSVEEYEYSNDEVDNGIIKYNKIFKTKKEAEEYLEYKNALDEAIYEFSQEEWEDDKLKKYYICYDYVTHRIIIFHSEANRNIGLQYFKTFEDAEKFVDKYEKQILKYEFEIEEEK